METGGSGDAMERARLLLKSHRASFDFRHTDQAKGIKAPLLQKAYPHDASLIPLIPSADFHIGNIQVRTAIGRRKSRREYSDEPLDMEELSYLLWATQGVRRTAEKYTIRNSPSGGARQPLETYLFIARVTGLGRGLYRYLPIEHALLELRRDKAIEPGGSPEVQALDAALNDQYWNAAVVFMWTAMPYRSIWRYGTEGVKLVALDAGHVCQNLYIACESISLGTCAIGAYDQEKLDAFLEVDGVDEFAIYAAPVGRSKN